MQATRRAAPAQPLLLERLAGYSNSADATPTAASTAGPPPRAFDLRLAVQQQIQRLVSIQVWEGDAGLHLMDLAFPPAVGLQDPQRWEQRLLRLEWLIRHHEPRLQTVRVSLAPAQAGEGRFGGYFIVEGRLATAPGDAAWSGAVRFLVSSNGMPAATLLPTGASP